MDARRVGATLKAAAATVGSAGVVDHCSAGLAAVEAAAALALAPRAASSVSAAATASVGSADAASISGAAMSVGTAGAVGAGSEVVVAIRADEDRAAAEITTGAFGSLAGLGGSAGFGFLGAGGGINTDGDGPAVGGEPADAPSVGRRRLGEPVGVTSDAALDAACVGHAGAWDVPDAPPADFCLRFARRLCFGRLAGGTATPRVER